MADGKKANETHIHTTIESLEASWNSKRYLTKLGADKLLYQNHTPIARNYIFKSAEEKEMLHSFVSRAITNVVTKNKSQLVTLFGVSGSGKSLIRQELIQHIADFRPPKPYEPAVDKQKNSPVVTTTLVLEDENKTLSPDKIASILQRNSDNKLAQSNETTIAANLKSDIGDKLHNSMPNVVNPQAAVVYNNANKPLQMWSKKLQKRLASAYLVLEVFGHSVTSKNLNSTRVISYSVTEFDHLKLPISHKIKAELLNFTFLPQEKPEFETFLVFRQFVSALHSLIADDEQRQKQRSFQALNLQVLDSQLDDNPSLAVSHHMIKNASSYFLNPVVTAVPHPKPMVLSKSELGLEDLDNASNSVPNMSGSLSRAKIFESQVLQQSSSMHHLKIPKKLKNVVSTEFVNNNTTIEFSVHLSLDRFKWTIGELKQSKWTTLLKKDRKIAENFEKTVEALKTVEFSETDILALLDVLSGIMHLGDLEFENVRSEEDQSASILAGLNKVATLWQIPLELLYDTIMKESIPTHHGNQKVQVSKDVANFRRNLLATTMYSQLFDWIMWKTSHALSKDRSPEYENDSTSDEPMKTPKSCLAKSSALAVCEAMGLTLKAGGQLEDLVVNYTNEWMLYELDKKITLEKRNFWMKEQESSSLENSIASPKATIPTHSYFKARVILDWISQACRNLEYNGSLEQFAHMAVKEMEKCVMVGSSSINSHIIFSNVESVYNCIQISKETLPALKDIAASINQNKFTIKHFSVAMPYTYSISPINKLREQILIDPRTLELLRTSSKAIVQAICSRKYNFVVKNLYKVNLDSSKPFTSFVNIDIAGLLLAEFSRHASAMSIFCVRPCESDVLDTYDSEYVKKQLEVLSVNDTLELTNQGYVACEEYKAIAWRYRLLVPKAIRNNNDAREAVEWLVEDSDVDSLVSFGKTSLMYKNESVIDSWEEQRERNVPQVGRFILQFYRFYRHKKLLKQKTMAVVIYTAYLRFKARQYISTILTTFHIHPYSSRTKDLSTTQLLDRIKTNTGQNLAPVGILKPSSRIPKSVALKFLNSSEFVASSAAGVPLKPYQPAELSVASEMNSDLGMPHEYSSKSDLLVPKQFGGKSQLHSTVKPISNENESFSTESRDASSTKLDDQSLKASTNSDYNRNGTSDILLAPNLVISAPSNAKLDISQLRTMRSSNSITALHASVNESKSVVIRDPKQARWPRAPLKILTPFSALARKVHCLWRISSMPESMQILMRRRLEASNMFRGVKEWDMRCMFKGNYLFDVQSPQQYPKLFQFLLALGKSRDPEVFLPIAVEFSKVRTSGEQVQRGFFVTDKRIWILDTQKWKPTRPPIPIKSITGVSMTKGKDAILIIHIDNKRSGSDIVLNFESHPMLVEVVVLLTEVFAALSKSRFRVSFQDHTLRYIAKKNQMQTLSVDSDLAGTDDRLIFVKLSSKNYLKALSITNAFGGPIKKAAEAGPTVNAAALGVLPMPQINNNDAPKVIS